MKIDTFNIRCDCEAGTRNAFDNRKAYIREKILAEQADIIGFQEVLPHVGIWLQEALADYYVLNCGRGACFDDESVSIAFHKDKYNLLENHTFWLSDTEDMPGSRYPEQSIYPRVCSQATFQQRETGKCFTLFNTHLDHESESARRKGMVKVLGAMEKSQFPVLLTGDLNTFSGSSVTDLIRLSGMELTDVTKGIGTTFHNYGDTDEKLDYIYISKAFACKKVCKWTDCYDGVYLSDHYPVCAELEWK